MPQLMTVAPSEWENVDRDFIAHCNALLGDRKTEYAPGEDRHHNFNQAAALQDEEVPATIRGMMVKHTVKLYDYIKRMASTLECKGTIDLNMHKLLEVCADQVNYVRLLYAWCLLYRDNQGKSSKED